MNKPVGGRGKKAPYETDVIRVPVPIIPQIEKLVEDYRLLAIQGEVSEDKNNFEVPSDFTQVSYFEALQVGKKLAQSRKSAPECLAKMLQVLYGGRVRKEDLK